MISLPPSFVKSVIDLACSIQQIPAPTFHEGQRALFVLDFFRRIGLEDIQQDFTGNVLARLPGVDRFARPLVVSAHLDTVHPLGSSLALERSADHITGRAIGDNATGLAAMMMLPGLLRSNRSRLKGDLWLAANTGEEGLGNLRGIQAVTDRFGPDALAYLVLEGMGLGNVLHRGLGVERYRITVQTPGGHSWVDYGQPSAIHVLCNLVSELTSLPIPHKPATSLNVGVISGGISVNSIAAHASCELDLRSEDNQVLSGLVDEVHRLVRLTQQNSIYTVIELIGKRQAGSIPENHPLVQLACAVLSDIGIDPRLDIASTDANLPLSRGYPAICLGITQGSYAHTANEYIRTEPVGVGMIQLYEIVTRAWSII